MHASLKRLIALAESGVKRPPAIGLSAIADALGESPQTANNWKSRGVSARAAAKAADVFGGTANQILTGAVNDLSQPLKRGVAQDMSLARPIVSPQITTLRELNMGAKVEGPFELEVSDGSFGSDIPPGCVMRLDPGRPPRAGWPVLVRDREGNHYLRDYQEGAGGRWQAVARVRGFAPLDSVDDGLQVVAVMRGVDWP